MHIGTNSKKLDISSEKQTRALAKRLSNFFKKGDLVFLFGEIGTGKTTFVKNFINKSSFSSDYNKDIYGVKDEFFLKITKKPIIPSSDEIKVNPRSRSAKLRIGERL